MTEDEAAQLLAKVSVAMKAYTADGITAIYEVLNENEGGLWGTATWVSTGDRTWLVSAHHVLTHEKGLPLATRTSTTRNVALLTVSAVGHPLPIDVAIMANSPCGPSAGESEEGSRPITPVPIAKLRPDVPLHPGVYFLHGFPGEKSRFTAFLPGVKSETMPYPCVPTTRPSTYSWYDPAVHFMLDYSNDDGVRDELGRRATLPDPHGLSGSLVWFTGRPTEHDWRADDAVVVGVVQTWDHGARALVCTRIDQVMRLLERE